MYPYKTQVQSNWLSPKAQSFSVAPIDNPGPEQIQNLCSYVGVKQEDINKLRAAEVRYMQQTVGCSTLTIKEWLQHAIIKDENLAGGWWYIYYYCCTLDSAAKHLHLALSHKINNILLLTNCLVDQIHHTRRVADERVWTMGGNELKRKGITIQRLPDHE